MTPLQFCYWLQGFFEISNTLYLADWQIQILRDHLNLVFMKETPDRILDKVPDTTGRREPAPTPKEELDRQQKALEEWRRQIDEYKQKQKVPLQQPPYISWKVPEGPQCAATPASIYDPAYLRTFTTSEESTVDASGWQPPQNPFIC